MTAITKTEDVAKRVKRVRIALGLSQVELAEKLQVAFSTINRWERGKTKPLPALIRQLEALEEEVTVNKKSEKK